MLIRQYANSRKGKRSLCFGQRALKRLEVAGRGEDRVAVIAAIEGMIDQAIGNRAGESSHGAMPAGAMRNG